MTLVRILESVLIVCEHTVKDPVRNVREHGLKLVMSAYLMVEVLLNFLVTQCGQVINGYFVRGVYLDHSAMGPLETLRIVIRVILADQASVCPVELTDC